MQQSDKIIAYYLRRKLAGIDMDDIQRSLDARVVYLEQREMILNEIERLEHRHHRSAARLRQSRYLLIGGLSFLLGSFLALYLLPGTPGELPLYVALSLLVISFAALMAGFIFTKIYGARR